MKLKIHHIWAVGCNKRYMYIMLNGNIYKCCISEKDYYYLSNNGVITSQALRYKKIKFK